MIEVNVRELKSRMSHYLRRVEEGEQIKITRRGKTVGTIIPTLGRAEEETSAERAIRALMAKGIVTLPGRQAVFPEEGVGVRRDVQTLADMIVEDRRWTSIVKPA